MINIQTYWKYDANKLVYVNSNLVIHFKVIIDTKYQKTLFKKFVFNMF